ncbi:uncharacterized protein PFL1_03415 [Pseudozyma flocculosa PF-1]|uniref:Uncharacterized protein n=1 Tax=Pseudozyma flocculosa PF-1 TaxID=1277687 RepID=A0A061H8C7_9BASI|nr:uncharacterized protein PFL1_03415 [Pseudozyma flocculosa PF-1]EPQ29127.1 hypothetical protein PFL1_03415 [Pseudozyma flocculosa PF-1]
MSPEGIFSPSRIVSARRARAWCCGRGPGSDQLIEVAVERGAWRRRPAGPARHPMGCHQSRKGVRKRRVKRVERATRASLTMLAARPGGSEVRITAWRSSPQAALRRTASSRLADRCGGTWRRRGPPSLESIHGRCRLRSLTSIGQHRRSVDKRRRCKRTTPFPQRRARQSVARLEDGTLTLLSAARSPQANWRSRRRGEVGRQSITLLLWTRRPGC